MICVDWLTHYPKRPFGSYYWCHLWDSDDDVAALHEFAANIGLRKSWFQDHDLLPHYDLTASKRNLAINNGARVVSTRTEWVTLTSIGRKFVNGDTKRDGQE